MKTSKAILGSIFAILILVIAQFLSQTLVMGLNKIHVQFVISILIGAILYVIITYALINWLAKGYLKIGLSQLGITNFYIKPVWILVALGLPILVVAAFFALPGTLKFTGEKNIEDIIFNLLYAGLAAGFVEEIVFRGVILNLLSTRWNKWIGILIPSVVFASLHVISRNLNPLSILQLLVAGTLVGIMFSMIEISEHSFWNDALVHAVWNIITSGIVAVNIHSQGDAICTYILKTHNFILTGGNFGMESSIIAILAYIIVTLLAYNSWKKHQASI